MEPEQDRDSRQDEDSCSTGASIAQGVFYILSFIACGLTALLALANLTSPPDPHGRNLAPVVIFAGAVISYLFFRIGRSCTKKDSK